MKSFPDPAPRILTALRVAAAIGAAGLLAACGQKGPLYMPVRPAPPLQTPAAKPPPVQPDAPRPASPQP
ncbi:MAG: lipoprotein [Burkholderiaceae bacterium]